jgi:hypothetical protein
MGSTNSWNSLAKLTSKGATALAHANLIFVPGTVKVSMPNALRSSLAGHPLGLVSSLIVAI